MSTVTGVGVSLQDWQDAVDRILRADKAPYGTPALDRQAMLDAYAAGVSPVVFARTKPHPMAQLAPPQPIPSSAPPMPGAAPTGTSATGATPNRNLINGMWGSVALQAFMIPASAAVASAILVFQVCAAFTLMFSDDETDRMHGLGMLALSVVMLVLTIASRSVVNDIMGRP